MAASPFDNSDNISISELLIGLFGTDMKNKGKIIAWFGNRILDVSDFTTKRLYNLFISSRNDVDIEKISEKQMFSTFVISSCDDGSVYIIGETQKINEIIDKLETYTKEQIDITE